MRFTYRTPGFTLIEIMIVVTMIAILAITVRPSVSKYLERGRDAGKIVDMSEIGKALRVYEIDKGSYPVGSIEGCYPQDTLVPNYLQKARVSPSGSKWDEGCGKNGLYGYGSSTYLMLLMANMENKNGGNYSGSTIGFTGSLSPLGYHTALVGTKRGTGSVYLSVDVGGGSTSSGGVTYSASSVSPSGPPPASTPTAGSCGGAAGQLTQNSPTINLCSTGVPSAIVNGTGTYTWSCFGTDGGTNGSCSAPRGYNVNFDGNGGSGHSPTSKVVVGGGTITTFPSTAPSRVDGYTLSGWYTQATGGTQVFTSQAITNDVTYFAQWLPPVPSFKVTWGGTNIAFVLIASGSVRIDWGDGMIQNTSGPFIYHGYSTSGNHQMKISGDLRSFYNNNGVGFYPMVSIDDWGGMKWDTMSRMFQSTNNVSIPSTPPDLTNTISLAQAFEDSAFNDADIANWDVSNVKNMYRTFESTYTFNQPLNSWNVGNVTDMSRMFHRAYVFNQPLNAWGSKTNKVLDMNWMFYGADRFNQDISSWDVSGVKNMSLMFYGAFRFNQPINNWNVSSVTNMSSMFTSARDFNQDLSSWAVNPNVVNCSSFRLNATSYILPIPSFTACNPN